MPTRFRNLIIFILSIVHMQYAWAYTISGTVTQHSTQAPLIGCSVFNLTKQSGTVTNEDGHYRIYAERGDVIQYTFIGMVPVEKTVIDEDDINIELHYLVRKIRDVVITGESQAKNSVLYNKNYERRRQKTYIDPIRKTARDMVRESAIGTDANGQMVTSPISLLYYALNKKVQRRMQAVVDIQKMDQSRMKYSDEFISLITAVDDEDEIKDIRAHCYFPHDLVLQSSYYELGIMLKECYVGYLIDQKERIKDTIPPANTWQQDSLR